MLLAKSRKITDKEVVQRCAMLLAKSRKMKYTNSPTVIIMLLVLETARIIV